MVRFIFLIVLFFYATAQAQVNLDKSYLGKTGNTLFYDLNEANVIWAIPKYLEAVSSNDILRVGKEYRVRYEVSFPQSSLQDMAVDPTSGLSFRAFRATQTTLEPLMDIDPKLKPQILPLGDMGMFGEKIPYNLILDAKHYPTLARHTAKHLFDGKHAYLLGRLIYYFSASRSGQLFQAQSVVAILTAKKDKVQHDKRKSSLALSESSFLVPSLASVESSPYSPQILYHSQTGCWDKGLENVICLKDVL